MIRSILALIVLALALPVFAGGVSEPEVMEDDSRARAEASSYVGTGGWRQYSSLSDYETATGQTIAEFYEAPELSEMVAAGELPPVAERLPIEPLVILPSNEIGYYGGPLQTTDGGSNLIREYLITYNSDATGIVPNVLLGWDANEDVTTYTFYLREGMRWSDGHPFTAEDIVWYYENVLLNTKLYPDGRSRWKAGGEMASIRQIDDFTIEFSFVQSNAVFPLALARENPAWLPVHYVEQFHEDFGEASFIEEEIDRRGFADWAQLFDEITEYYENPDIPTIYRWDFVGNPSDPVQRFERNPYYWKVDPEGNQLPYTSGANVNDAGGDEPQLLSAIAGDIDFIRGKKLNPLVNFTLLAEEEENGRFFMETMKGETLNVGFFLGYAIDEPVRQELYTNYDFRRALSIGTDRNQINNLVYAGDLIVSNWGPSNGFPYFGERDLFRQNIEFDPDEANRILDSLGLTRGNDGVRRMADGGRLVMTITVGLEEQENYQTTSVAEILTQQWEELGIEVVVRPEDTDYWESTESTDIDMYLGILGANKPEPLGVGRNSIVVPSDFDGFVNGQWSRWIATGGEVGVEPPIEAQRIGVLLNEFHAAPSFEAAEGIEEEMLQIHADNMWFVGLVRIPATWEVTSFHLRSSRVGNYPSPAATEINYVAIEQLYIKE